MSSSLAGLDFLSKTEQEAQLSQRDRTTLRVIEYFAKSFNLIQGVTLKPGLGIVQSLKMAPFDKPYTTLYWSAIVNIALPCTIFELVDVE